MASAVFTNMAKYLAKGDIDFDTISLKVLLVSSVPSETNIDTWVFRSDITNEITGTGYTAGGISQPFTLDALDTSGNRQPITLTDITNGWTSASFSADGCIIYKSTGTSSTDLLLWFVDFGGTKTCTAGNFSLDYTASAYIARA